MLNILTTFENSNLGGIQCDSLILIALEDIFSQSATELVYTKATQIYFTPETCQHNESQKSTAQGDIWEQEITFAVPKNRTEVRDWLTANHRKYLYAQYIDSNGFALEIPITRLNAKYTTGEQVRNRNEFNFKLEGNTLNPAKKAKTARLFLGLPIDVSKFLFFDGINDDVILPEILTRFIETNTDFSISLIFFQRTPNTEHFIYHAGRLGVLMANGYFSFRGDYGGGLYWENFFSLPIPAGNLHHIVITNERGKTNGFKLYKDGVLVTTQDAFNHNSGSFGQSYTGRLSNRNLNSSVHSAMNMSDIKIWDKILTDTEISNVFELINPESAKENLRVNIECNEILLQAEIPVINEKVNNLSCPLSGYATGAKGIVDINSNNIQLVP